MTFPAPWRKAAIEVWQTGIGNDLGARVVLVVDGKSTLMFENHQDALLSFVHVFWSEDEREVGVLLSGMNTFKLAWDVRSRREIPFESIKSRFARSIETTYRVPKGVDPFRWVGEPEAQSAFFALHPEIHLSYR